MTKYIISPSPKKVIETFEKYYITIPLEIFGKDPYKTLVSTLLSSRTKDEVTLEASKRLFAKANNLRELSLLSTNTIEDLIYPVGFYKTKAKHLNQMAGVILSKYKGKIPNERLGLMSLPGVGRKTANLVLNRAFGFPAIAVDTHVHRISNLLWINTKNPNQTEQKLNAIIPKKYWEKVNRLFVSIGRQYPGKKLINFLTEHKLL